MMLEQLRVAQVITWARIQYVTVQYKAHALGITPYKQHPLAIDASRYQHVGI